MKLTKSQQRAIEFGAGNLQLIACAGSGKTEVVARRVVHLLTPGRADSLVPANIIAFTFTEKAAAELKERIFTRTREALGEIPGMAEMFVGTIYAFCLELLKSEAPEFLKYEVLNEVQQGLFVDRHSKQSGLTTSTDLAGQPLKRYRDTERYIGALSILREADLDDANIVGCSILDGLESYRELLHDRSYLDYSSILEGAVEVLTNDLKLRERLGERVKYVIVDEYQDVNPVQEAIVWSLHEIGARICVVGDDDQTIYQWRGSDVENILTFDKRYPQCRADPIRGEFSVKRRHCRDCAHIHRTECRSSQKGDEAHGGARVQRRATLWPYLLPIRTRKHNTSLQSPTNSAAWHSRRTKRNAASHGPMLPCYSGASRQMQSQSWVHCRLLAYPLLSPA